MDRKDAKSGKGWLEKYPLVYSRTLGRISRDKPAFREVGGAFREMVQVFSRTLGGFREDVQHFAK